MGQGTQMTERTRSPLGLLPLMALALAGCVGVPALDAFKYATQSEREDAQTLADSQDTNDVAVLDESGNDTLAGTTDAIDAKADADAADAGTDAADADAAGSDAAGSDAAADADAADGSDAADVDAGPDVPPPECVTSTACAGKWTAAQLGACQVAACVGGVCTQVAKSGPCDDANACTLDDTCTGGKCTGESLLVCNDGDACSADKCDPKTGCYFIPGAGCDDGNACTLDTCDVSNACVHLATDATCSDNNACTLGDHCTETVCAALDVTVCNDDNACTDDSCGPASGCVFLPNAITCDDGDICTLNDACGASACVPGAKDPCNDGNACTDDACDSATGCVHVFNYVACDDGNKCTPGDTCQGGSCVGLAIAATAFCNDSNVCTDDACDPVNGCTHANNTATCDDGLPCTVGDACGGGKCVSGVSACECKKDSDCAVKEDGNPCNGTLMCDLSSAPYKCVVSAKTIVVCDASNDTTCAKSVCSVLTGLCGFVAQQEGAGCDADGSVCTSGDTCKSGACTPGAALNCDDGQVCTSDSCDKVLGCQNINNSSACTDGNACTVGDVCGGGSCVPGVKTVCNDGNACTADSCNASTGNCTFAIQIAVTCDDGNACSQGDTCDASGVCVGTAVACTDNNVCTSDACNPVKGCVYAPNTIACNDANACTVNDTCAGGVCLGSAVTATVFCDDSNVCTTDSCDVNAGCTHAPAAGACDDGNTCTTGDSCANSVCVSGTNTCTCTKDADCAGQEDGNLCNGTLFCDLGNLPYNCKVKPSTIITCSTVSDTFCAKNTCNPTSGVCSLVAQNNGLSCNADNSVCTPNDACSAGTCLAGGTLTCNDANPCTTDSCDPVRGCQYVANTSACSDGNPCTINDLCASSACAGTPMPCDDGNLCTTDSCSGGTCGHANNSLPCDDSSVCTVGDKCQSGACVGTAITCGTGNPCMVDSCDAAKGCQSVAPVLPTPPPPCAIATDCQDPFTACANGTCVRFCTDGNPCTQGDSCANGACQPGAARNCNDGILCTSDSCNQTTGACQNVFNILPCDDGNACTTGEVCASGKCSGTPNVNCDDGKACTVDTCDKLLGCVWTVSCDDGNPCTVDSCDKVSGACVHDVASGYNLPCDDGNPCTGGDYCGPFYTPDGKFDPTQTECYSGYQNGCDDSNGCTNDSCDTSGGAPVCAHVPAAAGTACNVCTTASGVAWSQNGTCSGTTCTLAGTPGSCDDGNTCTNDVCYVGTSDSPGGCSHVGKFGVSCDDGNVCTVNDACMEGGVCIGQSACNDNNWCTNDACAVVSGKPSCSYTDVTSGSWCDDGNYCTNNDTCDAGGVCHAGTPANCDDANVCTADSCVPATGCSYTTLGSAPCSGAGDCKVTGATCVAGKCVIACDDSNPCTGNDTCQASTCVGSGISGAIACSYGGSTCAADPLNVCVDGYCANICNDGNVCTTGDQCGTSGTCSGAAMNCNDANPCTVDACDATSGTCTHAALCNDGNPCTADSCTNGVCQFTNLGDGLQCGTANYCKAGTCTACGYGTVPTPYDDNGTKQLICAFDYPVWGIRAMSPSNFTNNGDNTVTDSATGLMWMQGSYSTSTLASSVNNCDASTMGSHTDWRLPTVAELLTLNDYVLQGGYSLGAAYYGQGNRFWAQPAVATNNGFDLNSSGGAIEYLSNTNLFYAKCVRGQTAATAPASRYTVSSDNLTVYDNAAGLLWHQMGASPPSGTLAAASADCATYGTGWRLPTIRELESIVDRTNAPASFTPTEMNTGNTVKGQTWSSTPVSPATSGNYWYVDTSTGTSGSSLNTSTLWHRCVLSCDDGNPCTTDSFSTSTWACTHASATDGGACGGAGTCAAGTCTCPADAYGVTFDDSGTSRFQCVFDYPVWGIAALAPNTLYKNADNTVSDSKTGLVWQDGLGSASTYTFANAAAYCDALINGSKSDWRLPSTAELASIVDYTSAASGPNISSTFTTGTAAAGYWTGRSVAGNSTYAWEVAFSAALTNYVTAASTNLNTRCVRGGLTTGGSGTRFSTITGTPMLVKDAITGLSWEQAAHNSGATFTQTLSGTACVSPFHVPNIRELDSIVDRSLSSVPKLNSAFSGGSGTFWSSTVLGSATNGHAINFSNGQFAYSLPTSAYYLRCVK